MSKSPRTSTGYRTALCSEAKNFGVLLASRPPEALSAASERAALASFARAAKAVPAYRQILSRHRRSPYKIRSIEDFRQQVPILDKASLFEAPKHGLASLCVNGSLDGVSTAYTSSGFSSRFAWGVETSNDEGRLAHNIDLMLETHFAAAQRRTLLINALPMGVKVPARLPVVLDTGPRSDSCLAAVKTIGPYVEQIVLVGEHPFLKKLIEEGAADRGVNWKSRRVFVVTGGEWVANGYADYIGGMLGHDPGDPSHGRLMINLGVSEIGLSIGLETPDARRLRRLAQADPQLRRELFGDTPFVPVIVQYDPQSYFIETPPDKSGRTRLVVTTLDPDRRLPLVRYTTGDWARAMSVKEVAGALFRAGQENDWLRSPFPFLAMWGRGASLRVKGRDLFPEQVKEAIYSDAGLARATTGDFRMKAAAGALSLRVQLRPGAKSSAALTRRFTKVIEGETGARVRAVLVPYGDFTEGLDVGYQRKFRYLG